MSKPREIKCSCGYYGVAATNEGGSQWCPKCERNSNFVHIIEKAKADKLAEALELIRKHGCEDSHAWLNAEQALKDYRGEA